MGKEWDDLGGDDNPKIMQRRHEEWLRECFRVLPPGGVIKAFSGTRTYHRLAAAMEAVGFILDPENSMQGWCYASGFPKSRHIWKDVRKEVESQLREQGVEGEIKWKSNV